MASDHQIKYGSTTAITCTLTSLADTAGRQSTAIDNSANLFDDALVRIKTNGQAGGTGILEVYAYAAVGDTIYSDSATGSDAAFTAAGRKNSPIVGGVLLNAATGVVSGPMSIADAFGGRLPHKWGLIFVNQSGAALSATAGDHDLDYIGVYYQSS